LPSHKNDRIIIHAALPCVANDIPQQTVPKYQRLPYLQVTSSFYRLQIAFASRPKSVLDFVIKPSDVKHHYIFFSRNYARDAQV
jgi:hypothetical protein